MENAVQHFYFGLICSLWREREQIEFVSQDELHDELRKAWIQCRKLANT